MLSWMKLVGFFGADMALLTLVGQDKAAFESRFTPPRRRP